MALRDQVIDGLRAVFGIDRDERRAAESPAAAALAAQPSSMFSIYGRDDLGGLLSVSQILLDRFADYEAMEEYPDIGCLAEGTLVYVFNGSVVKPCPIETIAIEGEGALILAFDTKRSRICAVQASNPRLTSLSADVLAVELANGRTIKATPDHKFLTVDGYIAAKDLKKGAILLGMFAGFNPQAITGLVEPRFGKLEVVADPSPAGKAKVYDITTETKNFIAEGVCVHNSTFRYFANDATQPSITDGRVIWTVSDDDAIRGVCNDLLHKKLRSEYELFSQTYTLDMYGNNYEEILVNENGVVGLNHLPAPTMRRVEGLDGTLIGYVQDISGQFTANSHELRAMLAGNVEIPKSLALFEDWQVVHFRLRSTRRRSPYGVSVAEGARWVWKRLIMLEDAAMIYRLNRIPRYAFYVDVTDVPPDRVEGFLKKMKRDLKKKKMVNPATGRLDMRYKPLCLAAETKIPQLDGTERTVKEMADAFSRGEEQWVYSTDVEKKGRILPGKVKWAGKTRENAELVRITLDNGESIKVTPDHKMIRRNGEFAEAQTLKVGDSLMPFRRGISAPEKGYAIHGYEWVYDPSVKLSRYTHRIVAGELGIRKPGPQDTVTHHKNFNKLNNDPRNLEEMDREAHRELHRLAGHTGGKAVAELRKTDHELDRKLREASARNITAYNQDPEKRERTSEQNRERDSARHIRAYNASEKHEADNEIRRRNMKAFWADPIRSAESARKRQLVFSDDFVQAIRQLIEEIPDAGAERLAKIANERGLDKILQAANARQIKRVHADMLVKMVRKLGYENLVAFKGAFVCDNHKIVAIEWLAEREDTYTLTVEPAHTFGVSAGIFIKNSQDEDFIVGVREGRDLARIEVVSAPDWQTFEDIDYVKRMLHGTLNVPRAWLGQDEPIQGKGVLCLTGDTKIPLLNGCTKTMAELAAEYGPGKEFYVYSIDASGAVTAGRAHSPQMTRPNAEVWEVELDNGEKVRGTPDHPFMLRDGSYRQLHELKPGDSLMPLYRRESVESRDRIDGYDMVLDPSTEKWKFTHRIVAAAKWPGRSLKVEGRVVHHVDFDKRNNDPRNLVDPTKEEHLAIHRKHADLTLRRPEVVQKAIEASRWWTGSEKNKEQCRQNLENARAPGGAQNDWCKSDEHRQLKASQMTEQWQGPDSTLRARTQTEEFSRVASAKMKESHALGKIKVRGADNTKFRHDASFAHLVEVATSYRCTGIKPLAKWTGYSTCLIYRLCKDAGMTYKEFANKYLVNGYKLCAPSKNHKVVSVRRVENADCYDFVVDGVHNYAIGAGIFVHNSNEDVRAARVTLNIQQEIKLGYERISRVHLAARGIKNPYEPEFNIQMTVPSGIYELAAYEVLNARADYATRIQPFTSIRWIQENILKWGQAEIEAVEKQRKKEQAEGMGAMGGMPPPGGGGPPPPMPPPPTGGMEAPAGGAGLTGQAIPEPPNPNATQGEWKQYDQAQRLEEWRYRESNKRHQEIMDKLGNLMENDETGFAERERERREFLQAFKKSAVLTSRGHTLAAPSGRKQNRNGNGH